MKAEFQLRIFFIYLFITSGVLSGYAGVSREVQEQYKRDYQNKAMFLKIPLHGEKQMIQISGRSYRVQQGTGSPRFKVGDQLRILLVDFSGDEIRFRMGGISSPGSIEIGFKFDQELESGFPNRDVFDRALTATLTEGVRYTDIEDAKHSFVRDEFERVVKEIAGTASVSQDSVMRTIAPQIPAYQDAQRELESLSGRVQSLTAQLNSSQSDNRKLEAEAKHQQSEINRLRSANSTLQEKIESSTSAVSKLGMELKDARGNAQGYQRELANLQRSLNLRVDANRDLTSQISDLGQAMRRLQNDNDALGKQIATLRTNLDAQQAANARLLGDNEELKAGNSKMKNTISVLTSKEDSLGKQYLTLKDQKEKLDDFAQAVKSLRTRVVEKRSEGGTQKGKANIYMNEVLLGSLDWKLPENLSRNETRAVEATISAESIDTVRLTSEERHILRTLGDRLKFRLDLGSNSSSVGVSSEREAKVKEIGERENSSWRWNVSGQGIQDGQLALTMSLVNKDSNEIPVFHQDHPVVASNFVRQIRGHLEPIPLAVGAVVGFLLFGIVRILRKPKGRHHTHDTHAVRPEVEGPSDYTGKKQL